MMRDPGRLVRFPWILPWERTSMRAEAKRSPLTWPLILIVAALMVASIFAVGPITTSDSHSILPLSSPSIQMGFLPMIFPSIFIPPPRYVGALPFVSVEFFFPNKNHSGERIVAIKSWKGTVNLKVLKQKGARHLSF